ncbi:hypothetical protein ACA910_008253 [Epithemia clementina (nom. ined.)]
MAQGLLSLSSVETSASRSLRTLVHAESQVAISSGVTQEERNVAIQKLLTEARRLGPVGIDRTEEEQLRLLNLAREVSKKVSDPSSSQPARYPLTGVHSMVYSAAPGGSSGKIVGPINGKVRQEFVDDKTFINSVELGPLKIALRAERTIMDDTRIKVFFRETFVSLFGNVITTKEIENNRGGVWNYLFAGEITDTTTGQRKLVRVMETPSLFIVEQDLD